MTICAVNKNIQSKRNFGDNLGDNILRLFDILPNFVFTASEIKGAKISNKHIRLAERGTK